MQVSAALGGRWKGRLFDRAPVTQPAGVDVAVMAMLLAAIVTINYGVGQTFAFGGLYGITICITAWITGFRPAFVLGVVALSASAYINGAGGPYAGPSSALVTAQAWASVGMRGVSLLMACYLIASVRSQYDVVQQQASRDPLTGLHNHCAFHEHLDVAIERARRGGTVIALAYLDLDDFKGINDRFGHVTGDRMLKEFADAARISIRKTDCIGRLGGDEFAILIEARSKAEVTLAVSRAHDALKAALKTAIGPSSASNERRRHQPLSFSMGAVIAGTLDRLDANSLVHAADSLMYRSKRTGRGTLTISDLGLPGSTVRLPIAAPVSLPSIVEPGGPSVFQDQLRTAAG